MPLEAGKSQSVISKNIETEKNAHPDMSNAQAAAIAYHKAGDKEVNPNAYTTGPTRDDDTGMTARIFDMNGWAEIKGNPISKVGVFPYSGAQISRDLDPSEIFQVYRPEEELSNIETIESFKLLPWTNEHAMLGPEDSGMLAPEKKGIEGVIGEDVYFADGYLKANIKVFSNKLAQLIDSGKKELSIGYRCLYDRQAGIYNGQKYDFIQRNIRGNHLALVGEGRSGHDVSVLDNFKFTFDTKGLIMPEENKKVEEKAKDEGESMTLEQCAEAIKEIRAMMKGQDAEESEAKKELSKKAAEEGDAKDAEGKYNEFVNKAEVADEDEEKEEKKETKDEDMSKSDGDKEKPAGMDSKEIFVQIARRDQLAKKLSAHVGTFDHALMTPVEVAKYGVKKLGLKCKPGHEESVLDGYFAAAKASTVSAVAEDSKIESGCVTAYLNGGK